MFISIIRDNFAMEAVPTGSGIRNPTCEGLSHIKLIHTESWAIDQLIKTVCMLAGSSPVVGVLVY